MNNSAYLAVDLESCRERQHTFHLTWSDKTPLKAGLMCVTCSLAYNKNAYAAYGEPKQSWGQWRQQRREEEKPLDTDV